jgi:hypothetical protein
MTMNFLKSSQGLRFLVTEEQLSQRRREVYENICDSTDISATLPWH